MKTSTGAASMKTSTRALDEIIAAIELGALEYARSEELFTVHRWTEIGQFRLHSTASPSALGFGYDLGRVLAEAVRLSGDCCDRGANQEPRYVLVPTGGADYTEVLDGFTCAICGAEHPDQYPSR